MKHTQKENHHHLELDDDEFNNLLQILNFVVRRGNIEKQKDSSLLLLDIIGKGCSRAFTSSELLNLPPEPHY